MAEKTKFFEIVRGGNTQDEVYFASVGDPGEEIRFQPVCLAEKEMASLLEEIGNWELVDVYDYKYEDLAYDDVSSGSGERIITDDLLVSFLQGSYTSDQVHGGYLIDFACEKRMGRPEELGFAIASLADERNGYLAGVDILCDGGSTRGQKEFRKKK